MNQLSYSRAWRPVDFVIAAVLGVACGVIFWVWNLTGYVAFVALDGLTPGIGGVMSGVWFLGGIIGALVIRKPGAALFVELVASMVSAVLGNSWGYSTLYSGFAQGLGAELVFLLCAYRRFNLPVAALAGAMSGLGAIVLELFSAGHLARTLEYNLIYATCTMFSGVILAGILGWFLVRRLAATGALDRFAAGRQA